MLFLIEPDKGLIEYSEMNCPRCRTNVSCGFKTPDNKTIELCSIKVIDEKVKYIHNNRVERGVGI